MIIKNHLLVLSDKEGVQTASPIFQFSALTGIDKGRIGVRAPPACRRMPNIRGAGGWGGVNCPPQQEGRRFDSHPEPLCVGFTDVLPCACQGSPRGLRPPRRVQRRQTNWPPSAVSVELIQPCAQDEQQIRQKTDGRFAR